MTRLLWLLLSLCPYLTKAQLKVGDSIPPITLDKIYNYPTSSLQLNTLDDKLVIVEFWSSTCMACISKFKYMHELQQRHSGKLQVIMVNDYVGDSLPKITKLFSRLKKNTGRDFTLPYVLQDSVLKQFFPFYEYPHLVWLHKGKVVALTDAEAVTDSNVSRILNGPVKLPGRMDHLRYKPGQALLVNGMGGSDSDFLYRTIITKYREELGARQGVVRNEDKLLNKLYFINISLEQLVSEAYSNVFKNAFKIINESGIDINEKFSLEAIIPPMVENQKELFLRNELARYFKLGAVSAEREIDTYTLVTVKPTRKNIRVNSTDTLHAKLRDVVVAYNNVSNTPVFLKEGIAADKTVVMPLEYFKLTDEELRLHIRQAGFDVLAEKRRLTVPVIIRLP